MTLTFLGTGPDQAIPRTECSCATCRDARRPQSKSRRSRSSLLIQTQAGNFLIDCSPDFLEQIKETRIKKIDAVFLTHRHQDAAGGLGLLNEWTKLPVIIFTENKNIQYLNIQYLNKINFQTIKPKQKIKKSELIIQPFRVHHGLTAVSTVGYLINNQIAYASDFGNLPATSQKLLKNKPIAIFDAALYFGRKMKGHLNIAQTIAWAQKLKIKKLYLTQIGHSYPPYAAAQRQINQYLKKKYQQSKLMLKLTYDGMEIRDRR